MKAITFYIVLFIGTYCNPAATYVQIYTNNVDNIGQLTIIK